MKKLLALFIIVAGAFALVACAENDETPTPTRSTEEVVGVSALASVSALGDVERIKTASAANTVQTLNVNDTLEVLEDIEELEEYLDLVRTFMGTSNGVDVTVDVSEREEYEYAMNIQFVDMSGEFETYVLHYNETIVDEDEEDGEFESIIEGVLVINGTEYEVYGEREVEPEEEEFELTARLDDENYVVIKYEVEEEHDEYEFELQIEIFIDNQLAKRVEIEFEREDDETEMELKFIEGNRESEYEFEIEEDGNETTIDIEFKITEDGNLVEEGEIEILIVYDEETGDYTVTYTIETTTGDSVIIEGDDDDDDDEDDEDDDEDEDDEDDDETENTTT